MSIKSNFKKNQIKDQKIWKIIAKEIFIINIIIINQ